MLDLYVILNAPLITYSEAIRRRKQQLIDKNNQNENKKFQTSYLYNTWESTSAQKKPNKYEEPYKGPYPITNVWTNGTVSIRRSALQECINIR